MGIFHGELTTLLWGGTFGFVWTSTVVTWGLLARHPRVRSPQASLAVDSGETLRMRTAFALPAPAFFHWDLVAEGVHAPDRRFEVRVPLTHPETVLSPGAFRGRYEVTARWELRDAFGLICWSPRNRWTTTFTVRALPGPGPDLPPSPERSGPRARRRVGRHPGDPLDVRAYAPGDDLRRIHWPLYAHADTLFVRTAEPSPPPAGRPFVVIDTSAASEADLDGRLGLVTRWLAELDQQGTGWSVFVPAVPLVLDSGTDPGPALAGLRAQPFVDRPLPPGWPRSPILVTGVGAPPPGPWRTVVAVPQVPSTAPRAARWWERRR